MCECVCNIRAQARALAWAFSLFVEPFIPACLLACCWLVGWANVSSRFCVTDHWRWGWMMGIWGNSSLCLMDYRITGFTQPGLEDGRTLLLALPRRKEERKESKVLQRKTKFWICTFFFFFSFGLMYRWLKIEPFSS